MKIISILIFTSALFSCASQNLHEPNSSTDKKTHMSEKTNDIYQFKVQGLEGNTIDLSAYKGKKILIVNTASECGYTPQYKELEQLYKKYQDKLIVIGFPANNFGGQEPGSNEEIKTFCERNYGVTFPMAAKVSVKGDDMAPIFKWLTLKEQNGVLDSEVLWNFNKFLIDENGQLVAKYDSKVNPLSDEITGKL